MPISKERLAEIDAIKDEDIDLKDMPELGEDWFQKARLVLPEGVDQETVILKIDDDILSWFRRQEGGEAGDRINLALREYMRAHDKE